MANLPTDPVDIVDALEERGDELSLRAAAYIRIKRTMERLREEEARSMLRKSWEAGGDVH